jgi:hypothetical protein
MQTHCNSACKQTTNQLNFRQTHDPLQSPTKKHTLKVSRNQRTFASVLGKLSLRKLEKFKATKTTTTESKKPQKTAKAKTQKLLFPN